LGGQTLLDQFTTTYLRYRWVIGAGIAGVTGLVMLLGVGQPYSWVVTVAGFIILAHAFASGVWRVNAPLTALTLDISLANLAMLVLAIADHDASGAQLGLFLASVLVVLLGEGWHRALLLGYSFAFAVAIMLAAASWDPSAVIGTAAGMVFVVGMVTGVVSSIKRRLAELEAARAETIGVVSHELRNHLTGVIGVTELITGPDIDFELDELKELLVLAHHQAVEASDVIEDLLTASRAERGVLDVALEQVDLGVEADLVLRRFGVEGNSIPLDLPQGAVWATADPHRFRQVLRNLISNADRYGGTKVTVSIVYAGPVASVVVSDDGSGVHPADESSIFMPYRRSRDKVPAPGSTGLGLWIARNLTRQMGGDLTYRRMDEVTVFEVTLPGVDPPKLGTGNAPVPAALAS
jgi:signal transduction histidine kinase